MKIESIVEILTTFFLDVVGTVMPGLLLLLSIWAAIAFPGHSFVTNALLNNSAIAILISIFAGYVVGNAFMATYERAFSFPREIPNAWLAVLSWIKGKKTARQIEAESARLDESKEDALMKRPDVLAFSKFCQLQGYVDGQTRNFRVLRSIAISIAPGSSSLTYKFVALSRLYGAMSILIPVDFALFLFHADVTPLRVPIAAFLIVSYTVGFSMFKQSATFFRRAQTVPFSFALIEMKKTHTASTETSDHSQKVYLAGGFHSGWQKIVRSAFHNVLEVTFLDPSTHNIKDSLDYTPWDLSAISASQIVFAYLEEGNPGAYALSLELGYAAALKKRIVLVDTVPTKDARHKYFEMVRAVTNNKAPSLEQGIELLKDMLGTKI